MRYAAAFGRDLQHDPKKIPEFLKKIDEGYNMVNWHKIQWRWFDTRQLAYTAEDFFGFR